MTKLRKIILAGLLLAASIVLNRFLSIRTPIVTIGFSFIPTILLAMLLGPAWTVFVNGLADLLGALLFPTGAFFPGYTFTAIVSGLIYGLLLNKAYKKTGMQFLWRLVLACFLVSVICNLGLNTLWTWYITKKAVVVLAPTRLIKEAILLPIKIVIIQGIHMIFLKSGAYKKLFRSVLEKETEESSEIENTKNAEIIENKPEENKEIADEKAEVKKNKKNKKPNKETSDTSEKSEVNND